MILGSARDGPWVGEDAAPGPRPAPPGLKPGSQAEVTFRPGFNWGAALVSRAWH